MDEQMEELFTEMFVVDEFKFDFDYEYEAPQFYDFTRPETFLEDEEEADRWFETAPSYPPSPFIIKLNWRYDVHDNPVDIASVSCHSGDCESMSPVRVSSNNRMVLDDSARDDDNRGVEKCDHMGQDVPTSRTRPPVKRSLSRCSTLMKPTASYLAKHDQLQEFYSNRISRRCQKVLVKTDKSSQNSSMVENLASKRQKLEIGYLCKVSHLKHYALFEHKIPKKVDFNSLHAKSKVTIPREPKLETAHRAQRCRQSKANAELGENATSNARTFKAHPLNRKILEAPSLPRTKKSSLQLTEFQVFQLRTGERARQHAHKNAATVHNCDYISQIETDFERLNSVDSPKKEKCEVKKSKAKSLNKKILSSKEQGVLSNIKHETAVPLENSLPTDKRFLNEPPVEQFSKLSLAFEVQANLKSRSKAPQATKGLKENAPASFHLEHEVIKVAKDRSPKLCRNQYQCGSGRRITEVGFRFNTNRKLDIR